LRSYSLPSISSYSLNFYCQLLFIMGDITMDNINFASTTFDNLDLNVLSSTKEEMDAKQGNF